MGQTVVLEITLYVLFLRLKQGIKGLKKTTLRLSVGESAVEGYFLPLWESEYLEWQTSTYSLATYSVYVWLYVIQGADYLRHSGKRLRDGFPGCEKQRK